MKRATSAVALLHHGHMTPEPTIRTDTPPFSPVTNGVIWAVLSAYARRLPDGPERHSARATAMSVYRAGIGGSHGAALVVAAELGLTRNSKITLIGVTLAQQLLERLDVPASPTPEPMLEKPMNDTQKSPDALHSLVAGMVAFYDYQLTVPEVRDAPNAGHIRELRETLLLMADEDQLSRADATLLLIAQRHQLTGITAVELGYPADPEHDAAVHTTLTTTGHLLKPYAALHGPQVQRVVNDLIQGHAPSGASDTATLLALTLNGIPRPQKPRARA